MKLAQGEDNNFMAEYNAKMALVVKDPGVVVREFNDDVYVFKRGSDEVYEEVRHSALAKKIMSQWLMHEKLLVTMSS